MKKGVLSGLASGISRERIELALWLGARWIEREILRHIEALECGIN
jgi:hypothetical protein